MNDSDVLHDAFRGFEQQADRLSEVRAATGGSVIRPTVVPAPRRRLLMVATTVVVVAAVATGVSMVVSANGSGDHGAAAGGSPSTTSVTSTTSGAASPSISPTPAHTTTATKPTHHVPSNRREMTAAFTKVLGNLATFTVAESEGNYIKGVLTAAGHKGGFDIQAIEGRPGDKAMCEDAETSHCKVHATKNGGSLSTGHESVGAGVLYLVNYVRPDGDAYLMHLSTRADPKGAGENFGSQPPLRIAQMVTILESDRW